MYRRILSLALRALWYLLIVFFIIISLLFGIAFYWAFLDFILQTLHDLLNKLHETKIYGTDANTWTGYVYRHSSSHDIYSVLEFLWTLFLIGLLSIPITYSMWVAWVSVKWAIAELGFDDMGGPGPGTLMEAYEEADARARQQYRDERVARKAKEKLDAEQAIVQRAEQLTKITAITNVERDATAEPVKPSTTQRYPGARRAGSEKPLSDTQRGSDEVAYTEFLEEFEKAWGYHFGEHEARVKKNSLKKPLKRRVSARKITTD